MPANIDIYPPVAFHFRVDFDGLQGLSETDAYFQDVSGLSVELQVETRKEGGENRFLHSLPGRANYGSITLKRGFLQGSTLLDWCKAAFENLDIQPVNLWIILLDENHQALQTFHVINAWPKKWSVSDFSAQESKIVLETFELAYQYFTID